MYKLTRTTVLYPEMSSIIRTSDGACIPLDPDNTDYAEYLKWIEAGNTPLPAEEQA